MDKNITVLVVEDILSARETVLHMLRALGFSSFLEAANGLDALNLLQQNEVGLVISDWNMPKMNGVGLLGALRANSRLRHLPFVFLTSKSEMEDVALASDGGASAYLIKPVTIRALSEALNDIFDGGFELDFLKLKSDVDALCAGSRLEDVDEAIRKFECIYPAESPRIKLLHARKLMELGEYAQAQTMLCSILSADPLFARAWEIMARLQGLQKKWPEALGAAGKAATISPNNPEYHVLKGTMLLHLENLREARNQFMTALNIDRSNDLIKQDIWNAYVDLDYVDEVEREFGTYIFSSLTCDTLNNMAVAFRRKGELKRALEIYRAALAKEPDNPKILFNAAVAYVNRKQYDKARSLLMHALGNDPGFEKASELLAKISSVLCSGESGAAAPMESS